MTKRKEHSLLTQEGMACQEAYAKSQFSLARENIRNMSGDMAHMLYEPHGRSVEKQARWAKGWDISLIAWLEADGHKAETSQSKE